VAQFTGYYGINASAHGNQQFPLQGQKFMLPEKVAELVKEAHKDKETNVFNAGTMFPSFVQSRNKVFVGGA